MGLQYSIVEVQQQDLELDVNRPFKVNGYWVENILIVEVQHQDLEVDVNRSFKVNGYSYKELLSHIKQVLSSDTNGIWNYPVFMYSDSVSFGCRVLSSVSLRHQTMLLTDPSSKANDNPSQFCNLDFNLYLLFVQG